MVFWCIMCSIIKRLLHLSPYSTQNIVAVTLFFRPQRLTHRIWWIGNHGSQDVTHTKSRLLHVGWQLNACLVIRTVLTVATVQIFFLWGKDGKLSTRTHTREKNFLISPPSLSPDGVLVYYVFDYQMFAPTQPVLHAEHSSCYTISSASTSNS